MTASKVNLGGGASKTKKVVSSTLAGVLAVGMIPAAGFAAEAADEGASDADIELLDALSPADNFSQGTISALALSDGTATTTGKTNQFSAVYSGTAFSVTGVTAALQDTTTIAATDYTGPIVTDSNGNTVKEIASTGTYTVTITGKAGTSFAGATLSATLEVTAVALTADNLATYNSSALTINNGTTAWTDVATADSAPQTYTYTGEAQTIGIAIKSGESNDKATALVEGTDYTVKYYIANTETAVNTIVNAGSYYAQVTGIGKYSGTVNIKATLVDVDALDLSDLGTTTLTFGDGGYVFGNTTALPLHPSAVNIGGKEYTNSTLLNAINVTGWKDENSSTPAGEPGKFYGELTAASGQSNVVEAYDFPATITDDVMVVTRVGTKATINYKNTPLASVTQPVVLNSSDSQSWSDSDITVYNGDTKLASSAYTINWAKASAPGTSLGTTAPTDTGEYIATISGIDDTDYTWAAYGTLEVTLIDGVIDCSTNLTVYYDSKNVKEINAIYTSGTNIVSNISTILLDNEKNKLADPADYTVVYKDADGNTVTEIENAGTYTLEVTSEKYQLQNNTVAITVAPETVTGLQMDTTKLATVNGQPAFNSTDAAPTVANVLDSTIQYKTNATEAAAAQPEDAWTAITDNAPLANFTFAITDANGEAVDLSNNAAVLKPGTYTVSLKAADAENANYAGEATCTFKVAVQQKFQDVPADAWYYDYVNDVTETLGYMKGYAGTDTFGPNDNIIRGDVAVVLYRMAGGTQGSNDDFSQDEVGGYVTGFADCDATAETRGMYYNRAIAWAKKVGIVTGYAGTNDFRPQANVTREEFATMLTRYAALSKDTSAANDLSKYPDGSTVSDWAKAAMEYVTAEGIMNGIGSTDEVLGPLAPQANVTRAEVAKMVYVEQPKALGTSPIV